MKFRTLSVSSIGALTCAALCAFALAGCGNSSSTAGAGATSSTASSGTSGKSDAADYYGLDNPKPMKYKITLSDQPTSEKIGFQTIKLKETKGNTKIYSVERSEGIAFLTNQEMRLEPDGIHNIDSETQKFGKEDMELPNNLAPGSTWKTHTEFSTQGQTLVSDSDFKVEGEEKVTTEAGEHTALLVTSTGYSTIQGLKEQMTSKSWYVRGLGLVKSVMELTPPTGKVQSITIQETK